MKITTCGSMTFVEEMVAAKKALEAAGHEVQMPPENITNHKGEHVSIRQFKAEREQASADDTLVWKIKRELLDLHFRKIEWSDAILVLNYDKRCTANYVGPNTLMEMALAFYLRKRIYLLRPIPDLAYSDELRGLQPIVLDGDLARIGQPAEALA